MKISKSKLREIIREEIQKLNEAEVWFNPKKADPLFKKLGLDFPKYPKEGDVLYKGKKVGYMSNFKGLMVYSKSLLKKLQGHSSKYKLGIWNPNKGLTMESLRNTIRKMVREAEEADKEEKKKSGPEIVKIADDPFTDKNDEEESEIK